LLTLHCNDRRLPADHDRNAEQSPQRITRLRCEAALPPRPSIISAPTLLWSILLESEKLTSSISIDQLMAMLRGLSASALGMKSERTPSRYSALMASALIGGTVLDLDFQIGPVDARHLENAV
jgi:hypothetical protein